MSFIDNMFEKDRTHNFSLSLQIEHCTNDKYHITSSDKSFLSDSFQNLYL